jgi:transmembrane sensor
MEEGMLDPRSERLRKAAEWWLRLREPNVRPETIAEWMLWCEAAVENKDAFASVQSLWQKAKSAPLMPVSRAELRTGGWHHRILPWAIAASVVGIGVLMALPWLNERAGLRTENGVAIATHVGTNRQVILPDGSQAVLGGATALSVDYTAQRRTVALNSGEAYFDVRPDPGRPFVVQTPSGAVAVVGTAFNVRTDGHILRVTVSNGAVEIVAGSRTSNRGAGSAPVWLKAGQQAVLRSNDVPVMSTVDPHVVTAWTTGTLKFIDEPLDSVLAAVNRYSPTRIEIRGTSVGNLRYTGTVVSGRVEEWLSALPNVFPIEVVSQDSDRIIIRARE